MLECKDCCLYETDACRYGRYALEHNMSIQCDDFIVEHNKAYKQGRADAIDECIKILLDTSCVDGCDEPNCAFCMIEQMEKLKEQNND